MRAFTFHHPRWVNLIAPLFITPLFITLGVCVASPAVFAKPTLNIYTYDSFASQWGPGPKIKTAFESQCDCELNYVAVDGSTALLTRVQLEGASSRADVVLGLDNALLVESRATGLLAPHNVKLTDLTIPFAWDDDVFLPFDYGYFAFIYDREKFAERGLTAPRGFNQLAADNKIKILIQDPRSSTSGLGLVLWVKHLYGANAAQIWRALADNIVTVTAGWSEAYGLFLNGEADMVLSYTTSPAYHMIAEQKHNYRAAEFDEGHGMQIEVAAQLINAPNAKLAQQFMRFIASDAFQSAIPAGNWMYPAIKTQTPPPPQFDQLIKPRGLLMDAARIAEHKSLWVQEFNQALRAGN